jgi:TRAP-type C4-dicarboxylate transport system permease small subunit
MKATFVRAMDVLQRIAMIIAGSCLVVITLIIPWGVFTRYVLGFGSAWPEPLAVLLMIWFSFMAAAVCYREGLHIGVSIATNLFVLIWGTRLVATTWYQSLADFPIWTAGLSYLPVPVGGGIIVLFALERLWTGKLFPEPTAGALSHVSTE